MSDADFIREVNRRSENGEEFCVVTVVRALAATAAKAGAKAIVTVDGDIARGFVGGACAQGAVRRAAREALQSGQARLIRVMPAEQVGGRAADQDGVELHKSGCPSRGTIDLFIEPMNRPPQLRIYGGTAIATALAQQAAAMGYRVRATSADESDAEQFPVAARYCPQMQFDDVGDAGRVGDKDFVVIATQGRGDLLALKSALASAADSGCYISMVCSRAKAAALRAQLDDGLRAAAARVKAPAGLDIGAIDPREIAVSILAEMIQHRRRHIRAPAK